MADTWPLAGKSLGQPTSVGGLYRILQHFVEPRLLIIQPRFQFVKTNFQTQLDSHAWRQSGAEFVKVWKIMQDEQGSTHEGKLTATESKSMMVTGRGTAPDNFGTTTPGTATASVSAGVPGSTECTAL